MALYRNVQTSFWEDTKVLDIMTPEDRYFMLYILTNPHTNQIGCYEISKIQMANETGYNKDTIDKLLTRFEDILSVIKYCNQTKEVLILNWYKYNWTSSPKVKKCIENELKSIKSNEFKSYFNTICIPYIYPMHTHPQEEQEKEEEQKQEKNKKQEQEKYMEDKFSMFWNEYPKKLSKESARKAFFKINLDDVLFSNILNALQKHKKLDSWKKDKGQFIPYPATWINQKRWQDEIEINEIQIKSNNIDPELENRMKESLGDNYGRN